MYHNELGGIFCVAGNMVHRARFTAGISVEKRRPARGPERWGRRNFEAVMTSAPTPPKRGLNKGQIISKIAARGQPTKRQTVREKGRTRTRPRHIHIETDIKLSGDEKTELPKQGPCRAREQAQARHTEHGIKIFFNPF